MKSFDYDDFEILVKLHPGIDSHNDILKNEIKKLLENSKKTLDQEYENSSKTIKDKLQSAKKKTLDKIW